MGAGDGTELTEYVVGGGLGGVGETDWEEKEPLLRRRASWEAHRLAGCSVLHSKVDLGWVRVCKPMCYLDAG